MVDSEGSDGHAPTNAERPANWRATCRRVAQQAAETDAWQAWSIGDDQPIPFAYRWEHVQQVVGLALWLAQETGADAEVVEAAAWLHDVRKRERNHARRGAEAHQAFWRTAISRRRRSRRWPMRSAGTRGSIATIRNRCSHWRRPYYGMPTNCPRSACGRCVYLSYAPPCGQSLAERRQHNLNLWKLCCTHCHKHEYGTRTASGRASLQANVAVMEAWAGKRRKLH